MIRAILWDLSGVLTEEALIVVDLFAERCSLPGLAWSEIFYEYFESEQNWSRLERGEFTLQEFGEGLSQRIREKGGSCTPEVAAKIWGDPNPFQAAVRVRTELFPVIKQLRDRYVTGLCTNNVREWSPIWRQMVPVDCLFEHVFDSSEMGTRKPESTYFQHVERSLGLEGRQILLIDDRSEHLFVAGNAFHWQVIKFLDSQSCIGALRELLKFDISWRP